MEQIKACEKAQLVVIEVVGKMELLFQEFEKKDADFMKKFYKLKLALDAEWAEAKYEVMKQTEAKMPQLKISYRARLGEWSNTLQTGVKTDSLKAMEANNVKNDAFRCNFL